MRTSARLALRICGSCGATVCFSDPAAVKGSSGSSCFPLLLMRAGPLSLDGCIFSSSAGIIAWLAQVVMGGSPPRMSWNRLRRNSRLATGRPARMGIVACVCGGCPTRNPSHPRGPKSGSCRQVAACEARRTRDESERTSSDVFSLFGPHLHWFLNFVFLYFQLIDGTCI